MEKTHSKLLKWSLVIGIIIVLNLFLNYALTLVYERPQYDRYFQQPQVIKEYKTQEDCLAVGGQWNENVYPNPDGKNTPKGYCDPDYSKRQEFSLKERVYERNVFIILVILGTISLLVGSFLTQEIISLGLSWGGVLSLIIASMRYWSSADNLVRVIILAVALGALIWISIKKFSK